MRRNIFEILKVTVATEINRLPLEMLGCEVVETVNRETGEVQRSVRVDVEVAKGQGKFSRCQFSVKIPDSTKVKVTAEDLEKADYQAFFTNLVISYIDSKGTVYFRADAYDVEVMEA